MTRDGVCVGAALLCLCGPVVGHDATSVVRLVRRGGVRPLPDRYLGIAMETFYGEDLIHDAAKQAALKDVGAAWTRFPGGLQDNYYDWRTGLLHVQVTPHSSHLTRDLQQMDEALQRHMPQGVSSEDFAALAQHTGAEVEWIPNLQTSTVEEQQAWARHLAGEGLTVTRVELGEEFYHAALMDPDVLSMFPDAPTTMQRMQHYAEALRPELPEGTQLAVQAAGASFSLPLSNQQLPEVGHALATHLRAWDQQLVPAPWFDAVTIHLYPYLGEFKSTAPSTVGPPLSVGASDAAQRSFPGLLAHCDEGVDRYVTELEHAMPGKAIWVTEYNPRGGLSNRVSNEPSELMMAHLACRMTTALLRHASVTMAVYFTLFAKDGPFVGFVADGHGAYRPNLPMTVVSWFCHAANHGATFEEWSAAGAPVTAPGSRNEHYAAVDAAVFRRQDGVTAMVQNASNQPRTIDLKQFRHGRVRITWLGQATSEEREHGPLELPAWSIVRLDFGHPALAE